MAGSTAFDSTDQQLIAAAVRGDRGALDTLVRRYRSRIDDLCRRMCRQSDDVEDITQETYLALIRNLGSFRAESAFMTWAYTVARSSRGRAMRSRSVRRRTERSLHYGDAYGRHLPGPDEQAELAELQAAVGGAVGHLSPSDRAVLLSRASGKSTAEVAKEMNMSKSAVKSRLHRARSEVKAKVGGKGRQSG